MLSDIFSGANLSRLQNQRLSAERIDSSEYLREQHVFYALNRAAQFLKLTSLIPDEYEHARAEMIRLDRRRWQHGGHLEHLLPTVSQILTLCEDSWDRALEIAELEPRPHKGNVRPSVPLVEALVRFYNQTGGWCSSDTIVDYARDLGFPLQSRDRRPWRDYVDAAAAALRTDGIEPIAYERHNLVRRYEIPEDSCEIAASRRPRNFWKEHKSACLRVLIEFKGECRRRRMPVTSASYRILAKGRDNWPTANVFQHHGGFKVLRAEAGRPGSIRQAELEEAQRLSPKAIEAAADAKLKEQAYAARAQAIYDVIAEYGPIGNAELAKRLGSHPRTVAFRTRILVQAGRIEILPGSTGASTRYRIVRSHAATPEELTLEANREAQRVLNAVGPRTALQLIRDQGPLSTAEIAKLSGRSQSTVRESWIPPLMKAGLVVAIDERTTKAEGWRRRRYALANTEES